VERGRGGRGRRESAGGKGRKEEVLWGEEDRWGRGERESKDMGGEQTEDKEKNRIIRAGGGDRRSQLEDGTMVEGEKVGGAAGRN